MHKQITWALRLSASLLVFSGYLALSSDRKYGLGLLLVPLIMLPLAPLGAYLEKNAYVWRVLRQGAAFCYIFFIPLSLQMFGLMDAVILLIIFIQFYLLLGQKTVRVYYELFLMSFFLLLAAVVQTPESMIAVALLLFGVSAVWGFATLRMYIEILTDPRRAVPEMRPLAPRNKGAMRTGNVFDFGLVVSLLTLSALSLVITVVVFMFTPRVEAGWLGRSDPGQAVTGLSETVRITGSTNISEDPTVVMHVQFPDKEDGRFTLSEQLYWRVTTLSRFTNDEWSRRALHRTYDPSVPTLQRHAERSWLNTNSLEIYRRQRDNAQRVRQLIYMDSVPSQGIPCLDLPYGVRILGDSQTYVAWDESEDFTLKLEMRGARNVQYEAVSDVLVHAPEDLNAAPFDYNFMVTRDYSILTYHELLPETQALARELTENESTLYAKVRALEAWLSGDAFTYTLNIPPLPPENSIDAFIDDIRTGHCELYASSLALMVRSLGIPARVVSGYRGGEFQLNDQAYLVRGSMAHLWVEVLFKDIGWVVFDPSPRSDVPPNALRRMRLAWSSHVLRMKMFWYQYVIGFQGSLHLEQLMSFRPWQQTSRTPVPDGIPDEPEPERTFTYWSLMTHPVSRALAGAAVLVGVLFLWRQQRKLERPRHPLTSDQKRIRKYYTRFLKYVSALGVDGSNKSAGEIWDALRQLQQVDDQQVGAFLQTYHAVRFGGYPFDAAKDRQVQEQLRSLRRPHSAE